MSPTALFFPRARQSVVQRTRGGRGEVYPGYGRWEGGWEGYTGYPPRPSQGPIYSQIQPQGPTYGQMKPFFRGFLRFPRYGSRIDLELTQN